MAAYGLYSHIRSNRRRSIALLIGLFFLVYVLVYAGALTAEALSVDADLDTLMQRALNDLVSAAPLATLCTIGWIIIAYFFHQSLIDAVTGGREVTRTEAPRLFNILENLCISRGITMPKLKVIESDALNAFATGMNDKQYSITVTSALIGRLNDAEIESVLGHELTHIRNGDDHHAYVAVTNVREFVAEHRLDLGVVKALDQSRRDGDRILLLVHAGCECVECVRVDHLELGRDDASRDAEIFQNIVEPRLFRARDLASAGYGVDQALMEEIGDDDPQHRAERG